MKATKEKGYDKAVCFGYGTSDAIVLPHECVSGGWYVHDGSQLVVDPQVTCRLAYPDAVPAHIQALVNAAETAREEEVGRIYVVLNTNTDE